MSVFLKERATNDISKYNADIVEFVLKYVENTKALNINLWKTFQPVIEVYVTQKPTLTCTIDLICPKNNLNILSLSYEIYHLLGAILRIKLIKKIEPLHSTFMRLTNDKYYYKMFKSNDLIRMIDEGIRTKYFMKNLSKYLNSKLNMETVNHYYSSVIKPLMLDIDVDSLRVDVMNRNTKAVYDITKDYYRKHSSRYILIKKDKSSPRLPNILIKRKETLPMEILDPIKNDSTPPNPAKKELPIKVSTLIKKPVIDYIKKLARKRDILIYILKSPKYKYPDIPWNKNAMVYLCTLKDNLKNILVDLYVNTELTKSADKVYLLYTNLLTTKYLKVLNNDKDKYFDIGYKLYVRHLLSDDELNKT